MDVRTRYADPQERDETLLDALQTRIRTAIPVKLLKDSDGHTVSAQPLVKAVKRLADGTVQLVDLPALTNLLINHHGGGGVTITHPHREGDEGLAIVCDRSLDLWRQQSGVQAQVDARMHNLSDAIYLPGLRSDPRKLENVSTTSTQVRSDDGKHVMDLHPIKGITHSVESGKHVVTLTPSDGIKLLADAGRHIMTLHPSAGIGIETAAALALKAVGGTKMTGDFNVTGNIGASGKIGAPSLSGFLSAFSGGLLGMLAGAAALMALAGAGDPATVPQRAAYTLAALWGR